MVQTQYDVITFVPCVDDPNIKDFYYKATVEETPDYTHYIFLYAVGENLYREPRQRWLMLDVTEHKARTWPDIKEAESEIHTMEAYPSMHNILMYVGDKYNANTKFRQLLENDNRYHQ